MKRWLILVGMAAAFGACLRANASEGGGGAYPNGAEDFMAGAVPPPGNYFINYALYYRADKFLDYKGDEAIPDFDLEVKMDVLRLLHVSPTKILGGFWGQHIFVPYGSIDVETPAGKDDKTGFGDIIVDPIILSWHSKNWHTVAAVDVFAPVGAYDKDDMANLGRNYWTFEPILGGTYVTDGGYEASVKLMYDINLENDDTKYRTGDEIHADVTLGMHVKKWMLGAGGFVYKQVTDDEVDGETLPAGGPFESGGKGQAFGAGPQVAYAHKNMTFIAKYQEEFDVEQKPEGYRAWFKFVMGF